MCVVDTGCFCFVAASGGQGFRESIKPRSAVTSDARLITGVIVSYFALALRLNRTGKHSLMETVVQERSGPTGQSLPRAGSGGTVPIQSVDNSS